MKKTVNILLIEDNLGDIRLIQEVLKESDEPVELRVIKDGEQGLNYLCKTGEFEKANSPDIILLDLNLPKKDGREVLRQIKSDSALKRIPVIIFSSSEAEKDIRTSYELNANCYIVKPFDYGQFSNVIKSILTFWLQVIKLPDYNV